MTTFAFVHCLHYIFSGIQIESKKYGFYVSWAAINTAMNQNITFYEDTGGF